MKIILSMVFCVASLWGSAQTASNVWLFSLKKDKKTKLLKKVTQNDQYDNQPCFLNDKIFYSSQGNGNTEIRVYDIPLDSITLFTHTSTSEFSPTPSAYSERITVVKVESDGKQRLWDHPLNGGAPELLFPEIEPVGYFTWYGNQQIAMFVLGEPHSLVIASLADGAVPVTKDKDIGRSLHRNPLNHDQFFYIKNGERARVMLYKNQGAEEYCELPEHTSDIAFSPKGTLYTGVGPVLYYYSMKTKTWKKVTDLTTEGVKDISRITVSADGKHLALVVTTE